MYGPQKMNKSTIRKHIRPKPYNLRSCIKTKSCRLFSFQRRYISWLKEVRKKHKNNGAIINCDVGLGKTIIVLTHGQQFGWNMLYICPTNVVSHIAQEIKKHFNNVSFRIEHDWPTFVKPVDIIIMSYYTVARLTTSAVKQNNWLFNTCVIDEVQDAECKPNVKNVILNIIQAKFYVGLTAAEKIMLLPLCKLVHAKTTYQCIRTFRQPPNFEYKRYYLPLPMEATEKYENYKQQILEKNTNNGLRKHQLLKETWEFLSIQKIPTILHFINTIPKKFKTVIVSNYCVSLRLLSKQMTNGSFLLLDTKVQGQEKRQSILEQFHTGSASFLLASFDIIFLGLDLGIVDVLLKMDISYAADTLSQLVGRLRRSGQKPKNLQVQQIIDFIIKDTCDEKLFCANKCGKE